MEVVLFLSVFCILIAVEETKELRSSYLNYVYQNPFRREIFPILPNITGFGSGPPAKLLLYNIKNPNGIIISPEDTRENLRNQFILGSDVKFVTHGWTADEKSTAVAGIRRGLDPAKPLFELVRGENSRLDPGDGEFVDVIHTCIGVSYVENLGHADFYPNGGYCTQPGCVNFVNPVSTASCAHSKAYFWYIDSIHDSTAYPAVMCESFVTFELGKCMGNQVAYMGAYASHRARGSYYLTTNDTSSSNEDKNENMYIRKK